MKDVASVVKHIFLRIDFYALQMLAAQIILDGLEVTPVDQMGCAVIDADRQPDGAVECLVVAETVTSFDCLLDYLVCLLYTSPSPRDS